jgi:hypothetical protein
MGCRNSPLTIKPYPMKIRDEYRQCFRNVEPTINPVGESPYFSFYVKSTNSINMVFNLINLVYYNALLG